MDRDYIECVAGLLVDEHRELAEGVAMRRAQHFNRQKDFDNCRAWLKIAARIRQDPGQRGSVRRRPAEDTLHRRPHLGAG